MFSPIILDIPAEPEITSSGASNLPPAEAWVYAVVILVLAIALFGVSLGIFFIRRRHK